MADDKEVLLKKTKSLLRAVLASSDEVKAAELQADYEAVTLECLPYRQLGYQSVEAFMQSVPDVAIITRNKFGEMVYKEAPSAVTEHFKHFTKAKKKSTKSKPKQVVMRHPVQTTSFMSPPLHNFNHLRGGQQGRGRRGGRGGKMQHNTTPRIISFDGGQSLYTSRNLKKYSASSVTRAPLESTTVPATTLIGTLPDQLKVARTTMYSDDIMSPTEHDVLVAAATAVTRMKNVPPRFKVLHLKDTDAEKASSTEGKSWNVSDHGRRMGKIQQVESARQQLGSTDFGKHCRTVHQIDQNTALSVTFKNFEGGHSVENPVKKYNPEDEVIRERIQKILEAKPNGLFSFKLEDEYKSRYIDNPPPDILERLSTWPDVVTIETISLTNQQILYPVVSSFKKPSSVSKTITVKMPKPGDTLRVNVTMIYDCSHFYVQKTSSTFTSLMEKIQKMAKLPGRNLDASQVDVGLCCIAKYDDDIWYRAEIKKITRKHGVVYYNVYFVDYGNSSQVSCLQCIDADICVLPAQAIRCSLYDCYPSQDDGWNDDCISEFKLRTTDIDPDDWLQMTVINVSDDLGCIVTLCNSRNEDLSSYLTDKLLALPSLITKEAARIQLPESDNWNVFMCYVNTTTDITIRLVGTETSEKLEDLEQTLALLAKRFSKDLKIARDCVRVGGVYMIAGDESQQVYNRIRLIAVDNDKVTVGFLDHGDTDVVDITELRLLPAKYNELPYQAISAKLTGLESYENNDIINSKLIDLTLGKTFVAAVDSRIDSVSLTLWDTSDSEIDKNINEMLAMMLSIEELESKLPKHEGEMRKGYVSYVSENGHIFFQVIGPGLKMLEDITALMTNTYENSSTAEMFVVTPVKGSLCSAKYLDSWFRVKIVDVLPGQQIVVYFVDYGNTDTVELTELRTVASKTSVIQELPFQAVECILHGLPPGDCQWTDQALDRVVELAPESEIRTLKIVCCGSPPQVELYNFDDMELVSINKLIAREIHLFRDEETQSKDDDYTADVTEAETDFSLSEGLSNKLCLTAAGKVSETNVTSVPEGTGDTKGTGDAKGAGNTKGIGDTKGTEVADSAAVSDITQEPDIMLKSDITTTTDVTPQTDIESTAAVSTAKSDTKQSSVNDSLLSGAMNDNRSGGGEDEGEDLSLDDSSLPQMSTSHISGEDILVTWVDDPDNIWAVTYSQYAELCQMMDEMQEFYKEDRHPVDISEVKQGHVYAAFYDELWYRGRILSVLPENKQVKVQFGDYGDSDVIEISAVHKLSKRFRTRPFQAFRCRLDGVLPVHEDEGWQKEAIERLKQLTEDKIFRAWFTDNQPKDDNSVALTLGDFSKSAKNVFVHKILIEEGLAKKN